RFSDAGIGDPQIEFTGGVTAIDIMTLNRAAGAAVTEQGFDMQLPTVANIVIPPVFDDLCVIEIDGLRIKATIDTHKMSWCLHEGDVYRGDFTDYSGVERYGVSINRRDVWQLDDIVITDVPTKLPDGRNLRMWFAEVPLERLAKLGYYGLYKLAFFCMENSHRVGRFSWVTVPAQQIKWERHMDELLPVNNDIEDVIQRAWMALDETGVRVKAETEMLRRGIPDFSRMKSHVFGAKHPVVMWLTEPESTIPFAVIATISEAWLNADTEVSFGEDAFAPIQTAEQ
ncbi:MAG: hypothetical protein LBI99_10605, partial [Propionibacteriaceae bacterium]|nr:hypothetical protein [Propionibacteriaceae bacterium]